MSIAGMPFVLIDTAGVRERDDEIEEIGVQRAQRERAHARTSYSISPTSPRPMRHTSSRGGEEPMWRPTRAGAIAVSARDRRRAWTRLRERYRRHRRHACCRRDGEVALDAASEIALASSTAAPIFVRRAEATIPCSPPSISGMARAHLDGLDRRRRCRGDARCAVRALLPRKMMFHVEQVDQ